jgi:hypothetical protein
MATALPAKSVGSAALPVAIGLTTPPECLSLVETAYAAGIAGKTIDSNFLLNNIVCQSAIVNAYATGVASRTPKTVKPASAKGSASVLNNPVVVGGAAIGGVAALFFAARAFL